MEPFDKMITFYTIFFLNFVIKLFSLEIVSSQFIFVDAPFLSCHASTLAETKDQKLIAAWFGGTKEKANDVKIYSSTFDGKKWDSCQVVVDGNGVPCWNPVLYAYEDGEILLFYKIGSSPKSWKGFLKRSFDNGLTWSETEKLPSKVIGPVRAKPIFVPNVGLICGSSKEFPFPIANECWIEVTEDKGYHWKSFGPLKNNDFYDGIIQPALFFNLNKELCILCRPTGSIKNLFFSFSPDFGQTWSNPIQTKISNPGSAIDILMNVDGSLLMVHNPSKKKRKELCISKSIDGGINWEKVLILEKEPSDEKGEFSYPAIIQSADGNIHITYTWKRKFIKHVIIRE